MNCYFLSYFRTSHAARTFALALLTPFLIAARATGDAPVGIYALGMGRDIAKTPQDERLANIRDLDFISGLALRMSWLDVETAPGQYNFSVIDEAIRRLSAIGQNLSLEILLGDEPQYVLDGANATYTDHRGGTNPVPWDNFAQQRQAALYAALGSHVVQGVGDPHPLSQDPTLLSVHAAPVGLNFGVRDLNSGIRNHADYTQQRYIDAVVNGVSATTAAFPDDTSFLAFFAFTDGLTSVSVDQQIIDRLAPIYNGLNQPEVAFFVENLSDNGPIALPYGGGAGNNLLKWTKDGGDTMMQALDSWLNHPADRNAQLNSRNPATGIELAYGQFGTRFFELYIADIDGAAAGATDALGRPLLNDLRYWHEVLTGGSTPTLTADFDSNNVVDAADLELWSETFAAAADPFHADADGDQDVDGADFLEWQRQAGAMVSSASTVPEPTAPALAAASALACLIVSRRRKTIG